MAERKEVIYVLSAYYSGSTLLNALLDCQPGVRGLSEAEKFWDTIYRDPDVPRKNYPYCSCCRTQCIDCDLWRFMQMNKDRNLYEVINEFYYDDAYAYVDASKEPLKLVQNNMVPPPGWQAKAIILAKKPHAFVSSFRGHSPTCGVATMFEYWSQFYQEIFNWIDNCEDPIYTEKMRVLYNYKPPMFTKENTVIVKYSNLASNHVKTVGDICKALSLQFDEERTRRPWDIATDSHMLAGNTSVYAQSAASESFFQGEEAESYLNGKYRGRYKQIFLDETWREDHELIAGMRKFYVEGAVRGSKDILDGVAHYAARLGLGTIEDFLEDLKS